MLAGGFALLRLIVFPLSGGVIAAGKRARTLIHTLDVSTGNSQQCRGSRPRREQWSHRAIRLSGLGQREPELELGRLCIGPEQPDIPALRGRQYPGDAQTQPLARP